MGKIETLEALNEVLEKKNDKIEKLKQERDALIEQFEYTRWLWTQHEWVVIEDFRKSLPIPRLEMVIDKKPGYVTAWTTYLVHEHYSNAGKGILHFVPIDQTTTTSDLKDSLELPWRDGFHIKAHSKSLGLPAFVTNMQAKRSLEIVNDI